MCCIDDRVSIIATSPTGEVCACDLPESLDRSQPTISHHLTLLVNAGLLAREQRGKWAWFRLRSERLGELSALFTPPPPQADEHTSDHSPDHSSDRASSYASHHGSAERTSP